MTKGERLRLGLTAIGAVRVQTRHSKYDAFAIDGVEGLLLVGRRAYAFRRVQGNVEYSLQGTLLEQRILAKADA